MTPDPSSPLVLVVEDEGMVRIVAAEMLEDAGCRTIEATTADEAMQVLTSHPEVGLVFTDIDMPGTTDGIGLVQWVRDRWPHIGLIVASGVHGAGVQDLPPDVPFLNKPYLEAQLLEAVTSVLARRSSNPL